MLTSILGPVGQVTALMSRTRENTDNPAKHLDGGQRRSEGTAGYRNWKARNDIERSRSKQMIWTCGMFLK
jgi:hypothetical protein